MSAVLEKPLEDVRATGADVDETELTVHLDDGRSVTTPLEWYPRLVFATPDELRILSRAGGRRLRHPLAGLG